MKLIESISINGKGKKRVELHQGDLTSLRPDEAVDLLVVSAFPNDYTPTSSSLIGSLYNKGLSVADLALSKEVDLRHYFSCWLSQEIDPPDPGLKYRRILCFEPRFRGEPPELVGDIFRSLAPILGGQLDISTIAMPLVAAGDQGYAVSTMLTPLLDAAIHWLESGLPLECIKIATYSDEKTLEAKEVFLKKKSAYGASPPMNVLSTDYDVFISYARENTPQMQVLENEMNHCSPSLRVFLDRKDIDIGSPWQPQIFESLDKCRKVVALLSPDYLNSKVCKEEFNIAWVRSREIEQEILFPIYLYSTNLPTYMKYRNYFDCREGDENRLKSACDRLLLALNT
jgi:hypothetical protein